MKFAGMPRENGRVWMKFELYGVEIGGLRVGRGAVVYFDGRARFVLQIVSRTKGSLQFEYHN